MAISSSLSYLDTPTVVPYELGVFKWFWVPTSSGLVRAVAVTTSQASLWIAAYALLLILTFVGFARIFKDLIVTFFPLRGNGNRYAILVGYYNTNDPVSIILLAVAYCWKLCFKIKGDGAGRVDWATFWLGIFLILSSILLLLAHAIGGVMVPGNLRLGNIARVRTDHIFYPKFIPGNIDYNVWQVYKGPAAYRAVSDLSQMGITFRDQFGVSAPPIIPDDSNPQNPQPAFSFNYWYKVSGLDFGLQRAPGLLHTVNGSCTTDYSWINYDLSNENKTSYTLWRNDPIPDNVYNTSSSHSSALGAVGPWADFFLQVPDETAEVVKYAVIPHTAGRLSPNQNILDPWYLTEKNPNVEDPEFDPPYRVRGGRPPLSCEQSAIWEFEGKRAFNVLGLDAFFNKTDSKLAEFFWAKLFPREFGPPVLPTLGNTLGAFSLVSSVYQVQSANSLDVSRASTASDLRRLVLGSLVYSSDVVRTTSLNFDRSGMINSATPSDAPENSTVPDGTADFVLTSDSITTMSVTVLITMPTLCLVLWAFIGIKATFLFTEYWGNIKNDSYRARYIQRTITFSAIQLYRLLDEELSGERRWAGRLSFYPYIKNATQKYNRQVSSFEIVPTSARKMSSGPLSPPIASHDGRQNSEDHPANAEFDTPYGVQQALVPNLTRPLVTPFARPAFVPLHERKISASSFSSFDTQKDRSSVGTRPVSFTAETRRPTSEFAPSEDKYELVMTRHWRPSLTEGDMVHWKQVQRE